MEVSVRMFAVLRELAGGPSVDLSLPDGATVSDALRALGEVGELGDALERLPVVMAVNRDYAAAGTILQPGDELALIPPVSGGAPVHVRVTSEPLDPRAITDLVRAPAAGAVITFEGVTRTVERLDYEAYAEMAEQKIRTLLEGCFERHALIGIAAEHRIGAVALGEPSVVVAVAGAHREETFAAAREAIDQIKAEAPIWKREVDGERVEWVEGTVPTT